MPESVENGRMHKIIAVQVGRNERGKLYPVKILM